MTSLITWFTNISTIRSLWFSRPGWDLTHLLTKSRFVSMNKREVRKMHKYLSPLLLRRHWLSLQTHALAACKWKTCAGSPFISSSPPWPRKYSQRLKAFRRMICLLGKVAVTEIRNDKCWVCEDYNCASSVTVAALLLCSRCAVRSHPLLA